VADCCLLQALGLAEVMVIRPVRVAILATGDELKLPGEALGPGAIYESNRLALVQMLQPHPVEITDLGIVPDQPEQLRTILADAASQHDLVISTGGVSVGTADYTRTILSELGEVEFWKVAMKPGKPVAFGRLNQALFFGLPGNPVSAVVTAHQLLLPALSDLAGQHYPEPLQLSAQLTAPIRKRPGRMEWQRVQLHATQNEQGLWQHHATPITGQGSHMIWSLSQANAYCVLGAEQGDLVAGEWVHITAFDAALWR
jgi:molybdopterin molybdotransferase